MNSGEQQPIQLHVKYGDKLFLLMILDNNETIEKLCQQIILFHNTLYPNSNALNDNIIISKYSTIQSINHSYQLINKTVLVDLPKIYIIKHLLKDGDTIHVKYNNNNHQNNNNNNQINNLIGGKKKANGTPRTSPLEDIVRSLFFFFFFFNFAVYYNIP